MAPRGGCRAGGGASVSAPANGGASRLARAALFDGTPGAIGIRAFERPEPLDGEVLVEVLGATICGSDLHTFEGRRKVAVPTVLGHEIVGRVAAIGPRAEPLVDLAGDRVLVGDRIVWAIVASCGGCATCGRGHPQKCERGVKYGHERASDRLLFTGGFADVCLLAPGSAIVRLPDHLSLAAACPASCATATVAAALEPAGSLAGRTVAVFGLGLLGLTACAMARAAGATEVVAIDPVAARRVRAESFGATAALAPGELAAHRATRRIDLALEVSGAPAAVAEAIVHAALGGQVHLVGSVAPAGTVAIDPEQIVRRLLVVRGIHNYAPRHLLAAVRFLAGHGAAAPFGELVGGWFPLAESARAFAEAATGHAVRIGVRPE